MKITKRQLKRIIGEELARKESIKEGPYDDYSDSLVLAVRDEVNRMMREIGNMPDEVLDGLERIMNITDGM